ncbi:hypothetical protein C8J57DRAFT_1527979 [Mycena rebaudengoi]|nr:hypothetical protein C8J57DRAFT_1527979 [Mycena rebaudengoi]
MVPPPLQDLMLIFLMVVTVSPLEIYFLGEPLVTRALAKRITKKYLGQAFGIAQSRQINPGIIQAFHLDWTDPTTDYEYRKQAGHSRETGGRLLKAALKFSERYHRFWGLDSKTGPVHKTAANLEEFSTPVGTISRWHYGSNDE